MMALRKFMRPERTYEPRVPSWTEEQGKEDNQIRKTCNRESAGQLSGGGGALPGE
mgnify:CR=1 FL=1